MSVETFGDRITETAGEDLSAAQQKILKAGTGEHTIALAVDETAPIMGVCTFPKASGGQVTCQINGVARVLAGAAITAGARVTADSTGRAVTLPTAVGLKYMLGIARETAAGAGEEICVLIQTGPVNSSVS
jgi:hypothetical protein